MLAVVFLLALFRRGIMDSRVLASVGLSYGVFAGYVVWYFH
jgi:cation:H+ antiporter